MASKTLQSTIEIAGILSPSLQAAINNAVSHLEEISEETLDAAGASEKLCMEMDAQESVLKSLQRGYADYVLSGQESSDEAQALADKIQQLSGELDENKGSLQAAEKAAKRLAETQDDSADAYTRLERTIKGQQDELEALRREYANVVLEQGKTSKEARQLESKISSLSRELDENENKLRDVGEAAEEAGRKAENSSEGYTVLKDVIANLSTEAIEKAVEAFKELATEGDTALAMLEAKTGATGKTMEGFEDVMYEVYNANYGESLGDVSEKLSTVIQMTDKLDNASLSKITKNAIALEDVFGFDVTESMRAVNSLVDQFDITSDEAFNLVVQGAQNGLDQNGDLLDTINEYSVQFKNAGYTAEEMFNMLNNGAEAGTWSVDKLGDAVKEFNIRASDGTISAAIEENAKAFGMTKKEAKALGDQIEGGSVEAYQKLLDKLKEVDDDAQRYQLGVEMFGTMWEDLGEKAVYALMDTEGAISKTSDAMAKMDGAAYDTLESSLSQLGRTIKSEVLQPIAEKLIPVAKKAVDFVTSHVAPAVDWVLNNLPTIGVVLAGVSAAIVAFKWGSIVSGITKAAGAVKAFGAVLAANPIGLIILGITALVAAFTYLWNNCEGFRNFWINLWDNIKEAAAAAGEWIEDTWESVKDSTTSAWKSIKSKISEVWKKIKKDISAAIKTVKSTVTDAWNSIKTTTSTAWDAIKTTVSKVWDKIKTAVSDAIKTVKSTVTDAWDSIKTTTSTAWEAIKTTVSKVWDKIKTAVSDAINAVKSTVTDTWDSIKTTTSTAWEAIKTTVSKVWDKIKTAVSDAINAVSSTMSSVWDSIKATTSTVWDAIKTTVSTVWEGIKTGVSNAVNAVSTTVSGVWNTIKSTTSTVWDAIKTAITTPINSAWEAVSGVIEKLKNAFNFSWSLPELKLPHISVTGGVAPYGIGGKGSLPKFSIQWYKEGGILTNAQIFGAMGGNLLGGGEAGPEAVLPLAVLWDKMEAILRRILSDESTTGGTSDAGLTSKAGELLTLDNFSLGSLADATNVVIYYDFSNFTWSPQIQTSGTGDNGDDFMAKLRAHEAEFFDWLEEFVQMREVALYGA